MKKSLVLLFGLLILLSSCGEKKSRSQQADEQPSPELLTTMLKAGPKVGTRVLYQREYDTTDQIVCNWFEITEVNGDDISFTEFEYTAEKCSDYAAENPARFTVNMKTQTFSPAVDVKRVIVPYLYFNWANASEIRGRSEFTIGELKIKTVEFSASPGQPASFYQYAAEDGVLNSVLVRYVYRVGPITGPQNFVQTMVDYFIP